MFDDIFFPHTVERYRAAPLVEQRERYLAHLKAAGARRSTLRHCANDQLSLLRLLDLKNGDRVSRSQIEAAAALWSQPRGRRCDRAALPKTRDRFVSHGLRWLDFLGWLDQPGDRRHPHDAEVQTFARWAREERGLSEETVHSYRKAADRFFDRLAAKGVQLSAVSMTDIDDAVAAETGEVGGLRTGEQARLAEPRREDHCLDAGGFGSCGERSGGPLARDVGIASDIQPSERRRELESGEMAGRQCRRHGHGGQRTAQR